MLAMPQRNRRIRVPHANNATVRLRFLCRYQAIREATPSFMRCIADCCSA
jgi:hypothetical protein